MTEESRFCKNCKQDVPAANFSLHEVHCLQFLTLCPECDTPVALKDMKDHQTEAHKQVRCNLCHQSMQQYQLEHHKVSVEISFYFICKASDAYLDFLKLIAALLGLRYWTEARTKVLCQGKKNINPVNYCREEQPSVGTGGNLCQKCSKLFPGDQYSQHMLTKVLAGQSSSKLSSYPPESSSSLASSKISQNTTAWEDVRPKVKERDQALTSKTLLKPPKKKKVTPSPTGGGLPMSPHAPRETQSFDKLATCAHCNIILPLPTLGKHEVR
ncbi:XAF1 factor, partial [Heliornis fulica]|nr:XAF1 factor [Heliornis fulica]